MIYPLNPTKELVEKLHRALDQAAHTAVIPTFDNRARLRELVQDPEIKEWMQNYERVKAGGNGKPRRRPPHEWRIGRCTGCRNNTRVREAPDGRLRCKHC